MKQKSMTTNPFDKGDVRYFSGVRKRERERFKYLEHRKVTRKAVIVTSYGRVISGDENVKVSIIKKKNGLPTCISITDKNLDTRTILTLSHVIADAFINVTDRDKKFHRDCVYNISKAKTDARYSNLKRHSRYEISVIGRVKNMDINDDNYDEKLAIIVHKMMDRKYTAEDILYVIGDYLPIKNKRNMITRICNKEIYNWVKY